VVASVTGSPNEFYLPHEAFNALGIPNEQRAQIAYMVLSAKYCALVEAVMKLNGGKPVRVSLERAKEIAGMDQRTDPRRMVMVAETKPGGQPGEFIDVRLATVDEIRAANQRYVLSRMGPRRN
jgi:hypothetical protein